jgi:hypothetical protein
VATAKYEPRASLDVIRAKSKELEEVLARSDAPLVHALLIVQELRAATGIVRSILLDRIDDLDSDV